MSLAEERSNTEVIVAAARTYGHFYAGLLAVPLGVFAGLSIGGIAAVVATAVALPMLAWHVFVMMLVMERLQVEIGDWQGDRTGGRLAGFVRRQFRVAMSPTYIAELGSFVLVSLSLGS